MANRSLVKPGSITGAEMPKRPEAISTAVRVGSITTDKVNNIMQNGRSGTALVSQASIKAREDGPTPDHATSVTGEEKEKERRHGSATLTGSKRKIYDNVQQASMETLLINRQPGELSPTNTITAK